MLCADQWSDLENFFANPDLRVAVLCSETPFVGDEPGEDGCLGVCNIKKNILRSISAILSEEQ